MASTTRKSLFSKPAWASKSATASNEADGKAKAIITDEDDAVPIFSSKHIYEDIVAQERERREKHAQRVKEREEKITRSTEALGDGVKIGSTKRRRISANGSRQGIESQDESEDDIAGDHDDAGATSPISEHVRSPERSKKSKARKHNELEGGTSPSTARRKRKAQREAAEPILLDADGDDPLLEINSRITRSHGLSSESTQTKIAVTDPESEEEDEYLRDLKRKARQDARLKKLGITVNKPNSEGERDVSASCAPYTPLADIVPSPGQTGVYASYPHAMSPAIDDPEIQILIETIIPGAESLVVCRHASQPLELVREYWCRRNELRSDIASKTFFTWNGTRLYGSTTMRGILEILKKSHPTKDGSDPSNGKIILEAMTDEIFQHRQQQQERRRKEIESRMQDDEIVPSDAAKDPDAPTSDEDQEASKEQKAGPVIKLVCPDIEPLSIRLRPHTTVSLIIRAFCSQRQIDPNKQCWLTYDGDRLEDNQTVQEIGFDTDDCVEVYLR